MRNQDLLFCEDSLDGQLRARQEGVGSAVDNIPKEQFLICKDEELLDHVLSEFTIDPLVLREDAVTMEDQAEVQVDVWGDPTRTFSHAREGGPFFVPGTRVDVNVPFRGEEWLFRYRTNTWSTDRPRAEVRHGYLRISISLPHNVDRKQFKENYDREMKIIGQYVEWSHEQVTNYNKNLSQLVQQAITHRRQRLSKHADIASLLEIPLATKPGAPSITPVKVRLRHARKLPVPPKTGLKPEPGIDDETYERILHFIRHQCRTFETAPDTFARHDEEGLRNIILAQLNGHFEGAAVGEVFRGNGKTDITIEEGNRSAFVGECKIWRGPASLIRALDQLLGYLIWRDSKSSLIMFNTSNKNFSMILGATPETFKNHALFVRELPCREDGEWRFYMRSKEDEGRRVTVHVFLFDLYQEVRR